MLRHNRAGARLAAQERSAVKRDSLNDDDRSEWIDNDEGLYNWWRESRQGKRAFIRAHRAELDEVIDNVRSGRKPASYLAYQHGADGKVCMCARCQGERRSYA